MLETMFVALFTLLPDYLFRRYVQGKRIGHEITFFTMWYELRWGLVTCFMGAVTIITLLFYFHPATSTVSSYFRTVTILSQSGGRVTEVYVKNGDIVQAGDPIFRIDSTSQEAAVEAAEKRIDEVEAAIVVAQADIVAAQAAVRSAVASRDLVEDDYRRNKTLLDKGSPAANPAEVERQANRLAEREGQLEVAEANLKAVEENVTVLLPAQKQSAEAALHQAQAELDKLLVTAGVTGEVDQFQLRVGDVVNPILRPAGILVPVESGHLAFQAGFNQLAANVVHVGMVAEMGCAASPFRIVPMVIVAVQDVIPSGQFRPSDMLRDPTTERVPPGGVLVRMEPLYEGGIDHLLPGSNCMAMAYTTTHDKITEDMGALQKFGLHALETIGLVHAAGLRLRMIMLPVTTLVFSGGH